MSVVDVVRRHSRMRSVERKSAPVYVDGIATHGTSKFPARICVQPLSGVEVRNLPPGQNATDWRNVWSDNRLLALDQVVVNGERFTIEASLDWSEEGQFWHGRAVRVREQA